MQTNWTTEEISFLSPRIAKVYNSHQIKIIANCKINLFSQPENCTILYDEHLDWRDPGFHQKFEIKNILVEIYILIKI